MSRLCLLLLGLMLAGCATKRVEVVDHKTLFEDAHFAARKVQTMEEVFSVNAEMEHFLDNNLAREMRRHGKAAGLAQAFGTNGPLKLYYTSGDTRNATETFTRRSGNCLSLVIMAGALARHLDLDVRYYQVHTPDLWSREGDLLLGSMHVNLSLGQRFDDRRLGVEESRLTIDFLPPEDLRGQLRSEIDPRTIVAMFHNNLSAESLVEERFDEAYWSARAAVLADPGFVPGLNSLGVTYRRTGKLAAAQRVFERALTLEPENATVLSNLEHVLRLRGSIDAAERIAVKLRALEPLPPYYYFFQAIAALKRQELPAAKDAFERELRREPFNHEIHFGLAATLANLGDMSGAREHLIKALENSRTAQSRQMYTAKLERLRALGDR